MARDKWVPDLVFSWANREGDILGGIDSDGRVCAYSSYGEWRVSDYDDAMDAFHLRQAIVELAKEVTRLKGKIDGV